MPKLMLMITGKELQMMKMIFDNLILRMGISGRTSVQLCHRKEYESKRFARVCTTLNF